MAEPQAANIPYSHGHDGSGQLIETSTPIHIDPTVYSKESRDYALQILHNHYLPIRFYDARAESLIHHGHGGTLKEYVKMLKEKQFLYPVMPYEIPAIPMSGVDTEIFPYIPNVYRSLLKAVIHFVVYLHKGGKSLRKFTLDNLVVVNHVLKFWQVSFWTATEETRRDDMNCIVEVMEQLFEGEFPSVLKNLHNMIKLGGDSEDDQTLLLNHICIKSPREVIYFIKNCHDKGRAISGWKWSRYRNAVTRIHGCTMWKKRFEDPDGVLGPIKECFSRRSEKYHDVGNVWKVNESLFRCCRNLATHLKDYMHQYRTEFSDLDIELMIRYMFEEELLDIQQKLNEEEVFIYFV